MKNEDNNHIRKCINLQQGNRMALNHIIKVNPD